jgi:hypothetical protein
MPNIPRTTLGTSDPVNICKGFALFPQIGTLRAGVQLGNTTGTIFNVPSTNLLAFRFALNASYSFFLGVCGPAYGIRFDADGSYDNNTISLQVANDQTAAGLIFGLTFGVGFSATLDKLQIRWIQDGWKSRLAASFEPALNINFDFKIDAVALVLEQILGKLSKGNNSKVVNGISKAGDVLPSLLGSYSIYGSESNAIGSTRGKVTVSPTVDLPINIVALLKLIPKVGAAIAAIEAAAFQISAGPVFSLVVPVDIQINSFQVDGATYGNLSWTDSGRVTGTYAGGPVPASPGQLGATLQHTPAPRFEYKVGVFVTVTFIKIFSVGATINTTVPDVLNLKPNFGTFTNTVSNPVGRGLGFAPLHDPMEGDDFEVVIELPEEIPA